MIQQLMDKLKELEPELRLIIGESTSITNVMISLDSSASSYSVNIATPLGGNIGANERVPITA